jgi:hypothetical protein
VIRNGEVIDYKSGALVEYDEATQSAVVKAAYVRQLRIYGHLVKESLGWSPRRGVLLPSAGPGVEVALDPSECLREATEAVGLLDTYNEKVRAKSALEAFASPSPQNCRWCSHKMVCRPFWQAAAPEWTGQLDGAAVEGTLVESARTIHEGAARAIVLDAQAGSENRLRITIAPLNVGTHPGAASLDAGDRVRLVGLRTRADGVLVPTQRTVLAKVADLPGIDLPTREADAASPSR